MLSKLTINFETNFIEEILTFLHPETRKKAIKGIKEQLKRKDIQFDYKSDIAALAEENLTVKEIRTIFREIFHLEQIDPLEVQERKAYYLGERIKRISINSPALRKTIMRELKNTLIQQGIFTEDETEAWTGLQPTERREKIIYHAANSLNYLEREDVFNRVLSKEVTKLHRPVAAYLRENFHYTISGFNFIPPFLDLLFEMGIDRIMFSADYPFGSMSQARDFLDQLPVSPADRERIAHENAEALMGV